MDYSGEREYQIVPVWHGNRDDAKPFKVNCRYLTSPERDRVWRVETIVEVAGQGPYIKVVTDKDAAIKASISSITDFRVDGELVTTARQLLELRDPDIPNLIDEIVDEIVERNRRRDTKN